MSLTWILRPIWGWFPLFTMIAGFGRTARSWSNLPRDIMEAYVMVELLRQHDHSPGLLLNCLKCQTWKNRGTPFHHPFINRTFPKKNHPAFFGYPHGNPQASAINPSCWSYVLQRIKTELRWTAAPHRFVSHWFCQLFFPKFHWSTPYFPFIFWNSELIPP